MAIWGAGGKAPVSTVLGIGKSGSEPRGDESMERADSRRLGVHLRRLREERKLTLGGVEALSEGFGERINKSYLFRVERGKTVPTIPRLRALAKVYRVKLARLVEALETSFEEQEKEATLEVRVEDRSYDDLKHEGFDALRGGDFSRAALMFRAAWNIAALEGTSSDGPVRVAKARHYLSIAMKNMGNLELAREHAEAALEEERLPTSFLDAVKLNLAVVYRHQSRCTLATEILNGLLARREDLPRDILAGTFSVMGSILLSKNPRHAAVHYRSALGIIRETRDSFEECKTHYNIGIAELRSRNFARAQKALLRAREIAAKKDYNFWVSWSQTALAQSFYLQGERERANQAFREANVLARRGEYYEHLFLNHYYLRKMDLEAGNATSAKTLESSLRFFATRIEETFEELEEFRRELEVEKEARL
jgi:transcriptional regulator with XRE-family HTH domain